MSHLEKRRNRWYAVLTIPENARSALGGKIRFVKSMGTGDKRTAQARAFALVADWKAQIAKARGNEEEDSFLAGALEYREQIERLRREGDTDQYEALSGVITDEAEKLDVSGDRAKAQRLVRVALGGETPIEAHLGDWLHSQHLKQKTLEQMEKDARRMAVHFEVIEAVTSESVRAWAKQLMTPKDQGGSEYSVSSVKRTFSAARSVWRYFQEIGKAPADRQPFKLPAFVQQRRNSSASQRSGKGWIPFAPNEVVRLHHAAQKAQDAPLADLIELGMYTGARIEELCSLKTIDCSAGSLKIRDSKTEAGIREVPIHSEIAETIERLIANSTDGYLLTELSFNKYGDRSNAIGKRFGRIKKRLGFGNSHVFHSIRKTVVTMLENAGISENLAADIVGHEKPRITYGLYSGGHSIDRKREALALLSYK